MTTELKDVNKLLLGVTEPMLKGLAVYSAVEMLKQPQFAMQATQAGLVELSDILYKYMTGGVSVEMPSEQVGESNVEAPKFG